MEARMNIDPAASRLTASGVAFAPEIASAAHRYGLDPDLLAAVAAQETGGPDSNTGRNVVGDRGHGHGLFQIDDRSHPFAESAAAMNPAKNASYAAAMLAGLLKRYGGNLREALSAYNTGSPRAAGTRTRWADGSELSYADSVLRHYQRLTGAAAPSQRTFTQSEPDEAMHADAVAESSELISALGRLSSQARSLPLSAPALPAVHQASHYQRHVTDYTQLFAGDNGETDSQ
jgi:hypothetical protein